MMKRATRHFVVRTAAALIVAGAGFYALATVRNRDRAYHVLESARSADYTSLPHSLADLHENRASCGRISSASRRVMTPHCTTMRSLL